MKRVLLIVGLVGLSACRPETVGEACERVMVAACNRIFECERYDPTFKSVCVGAGLEECCQGSECQALVRDSEAVTRCTAAYATYSCTSIAVGLNPNAPAPIPAVCRGVASPR